MCTLTWLRRVSGYDLCFNRDEQRSRALGLPPRVHERAGRRWIAPLDPDGGGTWIGVNEHGVCCALLNGYQRGDDTGRAWTSRGLLVADLLDSECAAEVERRLRARSLEPYRSFTLVVLEARAGAWRMTWDGRSLALEPRAEGLPPICSSSLDPSGATAARRALFARMHAEHGALDLALLERFHASHEPAEGPLSPCMHRSEAQTQSFTRVRVTGEVVELHYSAAAPCRRVPSQVVAMERALGARA